MSNNNHRSRHSQVNGEGGILGLDKKGERKAKEKGAESTNSLISPEPQNGPGAEGSAHLTEKERRPHQPAVRPRHTADWTSASQVGSTPGHRCL